MITGVDDRMGGPWRAIFAGNASPTAQLSEAKDDLTVAPRPSP
jgi:hypothetical protein